MALHFSTIGTLAASNGQGRWVRLTHLTLPEGKNFYRLLIKDKRWFYYTFGCEIGYRGQRHDGERVSKPS